MRYTGLPAAGDGEREDARLIGRCMVFGHSSVRVYHRCVLSSITLQLYMAVLLQASILSSGKPPFWHEDTNKTYENIVTADLDFPDYVSAGARDLIHKVCFFIDVSQSIAFSYYCKRYVSTRDYPHRSVFTLCQIFRE